jgi:hypothetical protein
MYEIKELHGSLYCTDSSNGDILYELNEPAVLFSLDEYFTLHKVGDKEAVSAYYNKILAKAKAGNCLDLLEDYVLADLPKDVEVLNRVYNNSMYLKTLFKDLSGQNGSSLVDTQGVE